MYWTSELVPVNKQPGKEKERGDFAFLHSVLIKYDSNFRTSDTERYRRTSKLRRGQREVRGGGERKPSDEMPSNEDNKRSSEEDYNIDSSSSNRSKVGDKAQKYADSEENPDHI